VDLSSIGVSSTKWLWDQYGKILVDKAFGKIRNKWLATQWKEAESVYRQRTEDRYQTTQLLGYPRAIDISKIYLDVYILEKLSALKYHDVGELKKIALERESLSLEEKRRPALRLAVSEKRLFVLGKPGSGKTTFLKYLAIKACEGKIDKTPIFISLKEWSDSETELLQFISYQFDICDFPNSQEFIKNILSEGGALVLFDGLDEVNQANGLRAKVIDEIKKFADRYPKSHLCISCRLASMDYWFENFTYVEIADFDNNQIRLFAERWFDNNPTKLNGFLTALENPSNKGLHELGKTPLLLALLCLVYEGIGYFPSRRADLYKEAITVLLTKWDDSRSIQRDEIYHGLSHVEKKELLSALAYENFNDSTYFIPEDKLAKQIETFMTGAPVEISKSLDGHIILRAIESQHGIIVKRARDVYSFLHLTFQEFFTAYYVGNNPDKLLPQLLTRSRIGDQRWYEVLLLTASLLDDSSNFFQLFLAETEKIIENEPNIELILQWVQNIKVGSGNNASSRGMALFLLLSRTFSLGRARLALTGKAKHNAELCPFEKTVIPSLKFMSSLECLDPSLLSGFKSKIQMATTRATSLSANETIMLDGVYTLSKEMAREYKFITSDKVFDFVKDLNTTQASIFITYLKANEVLANCLAVSAISPAQKELINAKILSPARGAEK
jgi:hypothetical protein